MNGHANTGSHRHWKRKRRAIIHLDLCDVGALCDVRSCGCGVCTVCVRDDDSETSYARRQARTKRENERPGGYCTFDLEYVKETDQNINFCIQPTH